MLGQRVLQECWPSAQRWLTFISAEMELSGKGGVEIRGVDKHLALFCRHLVLLDLCHLFSKEATRKSDILYPLPFPSTPFIQVTLHLPQEL
jgi:hypothetical protein